MIRTGDPMTPIDIALMTVVGVVPLAFLYFIYEAVRDMREMQKWWTEYNARMREVQMRLNNGPESGEVAKRPRAEENMS